VTGAGRVSRIAPAPGAERARRAKPGHFAARRATALAAWQSNVVGRSNVLVPPASARRSSQALAAQVTLRQSPLVGLPQSRADRASHGATRSTGAVEHDSGGDRAPGGNAALRPARAAKRPRTRECPRRKARAVRGATPMQAPPWSQGMNRYAYVFNDPVNATDPSGFISMSDIVGGFVAAGHIAAFVVPAIANGSLPSLGAVGVPTVGSSALTVPGLLQGQPGSGPTVLPSGPDLRLAQNMGDPSTGTDIPGNAPDTVARPDVPPQLGPSDAAVVALPRTLVAIAEAAEAWLVRAGAALRAIGPALSVPQAALVSPIVVPGDSVVRVEGDSSSKTGRPANNATQNRQARDAIKDYEKQTGRRLTKDQVQHAHREFGRHPNPGYRDLVDILKDTFGE
jgi:hypothetical protein